jgi:hypothetical protein
VQPFVSRGARGGTQPLGALSFARVKKFILPARVGKEIYSRVGKEIYRIYRTQRVCLVDECPILGYICRYDSSGTTLTGIVPVLDACLNRRMLSPRMAAQFPDRAVIGHHSHRIRRYSTR